MKSKISYFFELGVILPLLPILKYQGTKLRERIGRLQPQSEKLILSNAEPQPNILVIGESTAAGVGASSPEHTIASRLFEELESKYNIINFGKNGLRASQLENFWEQSMPVKNADLNTVFILIGANDCFKLTSPELFYKSLKSFIGKLLYIYRVSNVILVPIPPVYDFPAIPTSMKLLLGWHRSILNSEMKNLKKVFPTLIMKDMAKVFPETYFSSDGIHPSDLGYAAIAKELATLTKKVTLKEGHLIQKIEPQTKLI